MNRILRYALALAHTVIEYVRIDGDRVVVGVGLWRRRGLRCPICGRRRECYDRSPGPRSWRAMDLARSMCFLEYRARRASCPGHGALVESVPWARHKARFTRDFEDWVACLAVRRTASAVTELARSRCYWRSLPSLCTNKEIVDRLERRNVSNLVTLDDVARLASLKPISYTNPQLGRKYE